MKFLTRRKKKEKNDADLYLPPRIVDESSPRHEQQQQREAASSSYIPRTGGGGYRAALEAYSHTISPAISNEDGFGGSATLRSRSTKSGGKKHRTLIPGSEETDRYSVSYDTVYERVEISSGMDHRRWSAIPEEPRSPGDSVESGIGGVHDDNTVRSERSTTTAAAAAAGEENHDPYEEWGQEQVIGQSSSEASSECQQRTRYATISSDIPTIGLDRITTSSSTVHFHPDPPNNTIVDTPTSLHSQYTHIEQQQSHHSSSPQQSIRTSTKEYNNNRQKEATPSVLQPEAIYQEHYGDAYVDQYIKYLYPIGYSSMRPRSGPFKLSILVYGIFLWLSVFIVGHCYDRGQETYSSLLSSNDDAYLADVDDDALVMETRWCGSKSIYAMWFLCVSITMLALSYCSIIGYIKLRDVAVANGRSQPSWTGGGGRNDCYASLENAVSSASGDDGDEQREEEDAGSYQKGKRYPSIYQSDGTPQFWGGHIYRPTQAAVSMTNR